MLISLLVAEKSGFQQTADSPELADVRAFADRMTKQVIESTQAS